MDAEECCLQLVRKGRRIVFFACRAFTINLGQPLYYYLKKSVFLNRRTLIFGIFFSVEFTCDTL